MSLELSDFCLSALKNGAADETVNEIVNDTVNESERALISVISKNPSATILQIMKETKLSRATVTRALASLKKKGVIVRVGSDKKGYWELR